MVTLETQSKKKINPKRKKRLPPVAIGRPKVPLRKQQNDREPERLSDWENAS
jgi:hypothetical protein